MTKINREYNTISFVQMIDCSSSIKSDWEQVSIDSKSFIQSGLPGDEICVLSFSSEAKNVYPNSDLLVCITDDTSINSHTALAAKAIDDIVVDGMTNMSEAYTKANKALAKAQNHTTAYVMLTDGDWNKGVNPVDIMKPSIPLYLAVLGNRINYVKIDEMIKVNGSSRLYQSPNAFNMAEIYNDIRGNFPDTDLVDNSTFLFSGTNSFIKAFSISPTNKMVNLSFSWSSNSVKLVKKFTGKNQIKVTIISPDKTQYYDPTFSNNGYCIFDLKNAAQGVWQILVEYTLDDSENMKVQHGCLGVYEIGSSYSLTCNAPNSVSVGSEIPLDIFYHRDGKAIKNFTAVVECFKPLPSFNNTSQLLYNGVDNSSNVASNKNIPAEPLPDDISHSFHRMKEHYIFKSNGGSRFNINTDVPGFWTVKVSLSEKEIDTGCVIQRVKNFTCLVIPK